MILFDSFACQLCLTEFLKRFCDVHYRWDIIQKKNRKKRLLCLRRTGGILFRVFSSSSYGCSTLAALLLFVLEVVPFLRNEHSVRSRVCVCFHWRVISAMCHCLVLFVCGLFAVCVRKRLFCFWCCSFQYYEVLSLFADQIYCMFETLSDVLTFSRVQLKRVLIWWKSIDEFISKPSTVLYQTLRVELIVFRISDSIFVYRATKWVCRPFWQGC